MSSLSVLTRFSPRGRLSEVCLAGFLVLVTASPLLAGPIAQYGGAYANWPTQWTSVLSLNDSDDALTRDWLDFVGDATNPGAYWAQDASYAYFRMRVDAGTVNVNTYSDTLLVLVDRVGYGTAGSPDYSFAWDTNGGGVDHGLELGIPLTVGTSWGGTTMQDVDGSVGQKIAPPDFGTANGDGYVRTVDGQSTTNFGTTTYVDWAVSWSYLAAHTTLQPNQTWRIQFGSIDNATDHNPIRYDVAGNHNPGDTGLSWSDEIGGAIPEPGSGLLVGAGLFSLLALRRRR